MYGLVLVGVIVILVLVYVPVCYMVYNKHKTKELKEYKLEKRLEEIERKIK